MCTPSVFGTQTEETEEGNIDMQQDFHYYATYCAAYIAGWSHEESMEICYSAQFVDECSRILLKKLGGPSSAATTQLQIELADAGSDPVSLQDMTRIWASFHFLPRDLKAEKKKCSKKYRDRYRLICGPNGELISDTVELAAGGSLQAAGIAMHVLADTWAHRYFAGTPSLVINNTNYYFYELIPAEEGMEERKIAFNHNPQSADEPEVSKYTNSMFRNTENSIMNLGHGRAGHLPDYSFIRYRYLPAWGGYEEIVKDNPSDYMHAFCQMIHALKFLKGLAGSFEREVYDEKAIEPWRDEIVAILERRQLDASDDWKAFGEKLSGCEILDFDIDRYQEEYMTASGEDRDDTFLGKFFLAAMAHKSMVSGKIYQSGNRLAGISVDFAEKGFKGIRDFEALVDKGGDES